MANTLKLYRDGAVGFIEWLGCRVASSKVLKSRSILNQLALIVQTSQVFDRVALILTARH